MEQLLQMAKKVCDQAEIFSTSYTDDSVFFENARLHNIDSKRQSGFSLRIIKDGKLGFAYTRNLIDRQELLNNALDSLKGGVEANYDFPLTKGLPQPETFDPSIEKVSSTQLVEECTRVCDLIKSQTDSEVEAAASVSTSELRIINTAGTDISTKEGGFGVFGHLVYPGSGIGIYRIFQSKRFEKMPDELTTELIDLYKLSSKVLQPKGGSMKVLFMPNSMITLNWRLLSGTNGKSVYKKVSPVADMTGKKIFDEKITIYDDPQNDRFPGARAFDDEGVACSKFSIVQKGVLESFYYDLEHAQKMNVQPTGHGYRTGMWGGDPIALKPTPALSRMIIKPGDKSLWELVKSMDRGVIVENALGAHSGNIPNGDYSIGADPALYVENGEIVGRVKDAMVAGNVYETLKNVVDLGDTLYPSQDESWVPAILCHDVSVAMKN